MYTGHISFSGPVFMPYSYPTGYLFLLNTLRDFNSVFVTLSIPPSVSRCMPPIKIDKYSSRIFLVFHTLPYRIHVSHPLTLFIPIPWCISTSYPPTYIKKRLNTQKKKKYVLIRPYTGLTQHRRAFGVGTHRSNKVLEYIHSDMWGPSPTPSHSGKLYYVLFIDDYSRFVWVYFLHNKSNVFATFK